MFWKIYLLWISLFQITICYGTEDMEHARRSGRSANHPSGGSYKIMNRKPQVNKRGADPPLVFPGLSSRGAEEFELIIPDDCKKIGICEDIPNYPEDFVNQIIEELQQRNATRFNKDILPPPQIAERIGPDSDTLDLCNSKETIYAPEAARDVNKQWFLILNNKSKPQQTFRVEKCNDNNSPCNRVAFFQNGYTGQCVQKYMLRQMLALDGKKEVVERSFEVPSCCSCVAKTV